MNKPTFIETIKVKDGVIYNLPLHQRRMEDTMAFHFESKTFPELYDMIVIPDEYRKGLVKCRVLYADSLLNVDYQTYSFRRIERLKLVVDDAVDYSYKAEDRAELNKLRALAGVNEDILIVKNGEITDTSFSNVVFQNADGFYTPSATLLKGNKRKSLLEQGIIGERKIEVADLAEFSKVYLINAMIDLEDEVAVPISQIGFL